MAYEYLILHISDMTYRTLNEIGAVGWELVTVHNGQGYFKRPKVARKEQQPVNDAAPKKRTTRKRHTKKAVS